MSSPSNRDDRDIAEGLLEFLGSVARVLTWIGVGATVISVGFLVYTALAADASGVSIGQAQNNVSLFGKILVAGVLCLGTGTTYLFWGEDVLGGIQLLVAAALYFSPLYLPSMGIDPTKPGAAAALESLRNGGLILGVIGLLVLVVELAGKARDRMQQGSKADQLKYGKGIKEERDRQNVFMGKCWQLPFCRKFVRERCPIYHAKRTCWKELVGCMCEESVIRNAMENKPIPKDALLAANLIPHNHKLTPLQKRERCKTCVIYNEHQKHKYKLALPLVLVTFGLFYFLLREPLLRATGGVIKAVDHAFHAATFGSGNSGQPPGGEWFTEVLTVCFMIILFTYVMKLLEYLIFKLKV